MRTGLRPPLDGPALEAHLAVRLGAFQLDVRIDVPEGQTVVLLGPNGSGKTTCLELLAGLMRPDHGRVAFRGRTLFDSHTGEDLLPEDRRVGLVFQDYALFPHESVRGNVGYGPRARGVPRAMADRLVSEWIERLDLDGLAERPVSRLSGGQKQRVALARALAAGAEILLLDEPFASLDASTRAAVRAELRGFLQDLGLPALVVTHDPLDAFVVGERLVVIEDGRVVQSGREEELLAHPRTPFVADLVGLNFYEADLAAGSGLKEARTGGIAFHVLADHLEGSVHLAFAPSDVALGAHPPEGSFQNAFPVRILDVLSLPDRVRLVLDAGVPMAADVTREARDRLRLEPGSSQWAMIKATSIRVYP